MFALASAALATGTSTGWDNGTFRFFYLFGAVLNVPWLALGTVYLLRGETVGRRAQWGLVFFSGLAAGVLFSAPMKPVSGLAIPVGKDVFGAFPRVLAAVGSGVGAVVIIAGAVVSAVRYARDRRCRRLGPARSGERADRAGHARPVERWAGTGHRRPRRGVRAEPRHRDQRRLRRLPRRRGFAPAPAGRADAGPAPGSPSPQPAGPSQS